MILSYILVLFLAFSVHAKTLKPCNNIGRKKGDWKDCYYYYLCTEKGWERRECESWEHYNSVKRVCEFDPDDWRKTCETYEHAQKEEESGDILVVKPCKQIGEMKGDIDCEFYHVCTEKGWVTRDCGEFGRFNTFLKMCEHKEEYSFLSCVNGEEAYNDDDDSEPQGPCNNVGELKPDPIECNKYYQCTTYGWQNMSCSSTLVFNPSSLICDYPDNVKC